MASGEMQRPAPYASSPAKKQKTINRCGVPMNRNADRKKLKTINHKQTPCTLTNLTNPSYF